MSDHPVYETIYERLRDALRGERPVALATVTAGPNIGAKLLVEPDGTVLGTLGDPDLDRVVGRDALGELEAGLTATRHYGAHGEAREDTVSVFVESFAPPPRMVIFGAVDFTRALANVAKVLGYRVVVCDARAVFATRQRFPMADEVVNEWPDRYLEKIGDDLGPRDAVCVLTHDTKFDVPAIVGSLATRVGYLGAMGSRRTHDKRTQRLREAGVTDDGLARIHAPIGLDIGGRTPEETAISICAEIIANRTGRIPKALRDTSGPIHDQQAPAPAARGRGRQLMDLGIAGRRAIVPASSGGLGYATAAALVEAGVRVAICSRSEERIHAAAVRLGELAVPLVADVSTEAGAVGFVREATDLLGGVDILVTNGAGPPAGTFATTDLAAYRSAFELNCLTAIAMCSEVVPAMQAQGWGRVLAITSYGVRQPIATLILSNTARSGLTAFLKTLAREVAADGVTVNSLQPGLHDTDRIRALHGGDLAGAAASVPAGVIGRAEDFGQIAAFLCSEHARYVTGVGLPVDGGAVAGLL